MPLDRPLALPFAKIGLLFAVYSQLCQAFIPPVTALLKEVFSGRKTSIAFEISFSHKVRISNNSDFFVITERVIRDKNHIFILWKSPTFEGVIPGSWNGKEYRLPDDKIYPSDSRVFMRTLFSTSAEDLISALTNEEFIRKEQSYQYKSDFKFEGDPNYWNMRDNYLLAPDVTLKRTPSGTAFAITGLVDGKNGRTVLIDRSLKGIARLEWQSESGTTAWNFSDFTPQPMGGYFPKHILFETSGLSLVESTLEFARPLHAENLREVKKTFAQAVKNHPPLPSTLDAGLKVLLSFR